MKGAARAGLWKEYYKKKEKGMFKSSSKSKSIRRNGIVEGT